MKTKIFLTPERHGQMAHDMELKNLPESESDLEIIMKESVESDQQVEILYITISEIRLNIILVCEHIVLIYVSLTSVVIFQCQRGGWRLEGHM